MKCVIWNKLFTRIFLLNESSVLKKKTFQYQTTKVIKTYNEELIFLQLSLRKVLMSKKFLNLPIVWCKKHMQVWGKTERRFKISILYSLGGLIYFFLSNKKKILLLPSSLRFVCLFLRTARTLHSLKVSNRLTKYSPDVTS